MSAYGEQVELIARQEQIQKELEDCGEDMDRMADLLDELQELNSQAADLDVKRLDKKIDQMMPELGFSPDDNDRLVASYRQGLLSRAPVRSASLMARCWCRRLGTKYIHSCRLVQGQAPGGGLIQLGSSPLCVHDPICRRSACDWHARAHPY